MDFLTVSAILFGMICIIILLLLVAWKRKVASFPPIARIRAAPIIGTPFYFKTDPHELFLQLQEFSRSNDYLYVMWFFFQPVVSSSKVEFVEFMLSTQEHISKSSLYVFLHDWLGTGLLTSTGLKWKKRRRAITPSFHFAILTEFQKVFIAQSNVLVSKLKNFARHGTTFDVQIPVSLAALDVICETAMGVTANAQNDTNSAYVDAINEVNKEVQVRQKSPWLWINWIYSVSGSGRNFYKNLNVLHSFTASVISDRIKSRKDASTVNEARPKKAFLDMLLDLYDKDEIDVEGIREEVDTFMFEGHDTTATGLSWILYCLGNNLHVQNKLHAEIDKYDKEEGDLADKIKSVKYLEYVIKEGLRLHPPVPYFGRTLKKEAVIDNVRYPAGTDILIEVIMIHTNPKYWKKPMEFYPERFGEDEFLQRNPYVYIPFSAGPRNCVGQKFAMLEIKIFLYQIMLNYEIRSIQKEEDVQSCFEIVHKSNNGLSVKLISRNSS